MAATAGEKEIKRNYPHKSGIEANEKHEGRVKNLVAQEESLVLERNKVGINT